MKITIFNGSPRGKNGNTQVMIEALLEGARSAGAKVENICLVYENIKQCTGCFGCWSATPGKCVLHDDMAGLLKKFLASDIVGLATPLYTGTMTGLLKNFLDRMLPLATPQIHKNADGSFYHEGRISAYPSIICISNAGFPGKNNFDLLHNVFSLYRPIAEIYRNAGELLRTEYPFVAEYKQVLFQAGKELATAKSITPETMAALERDMISDDEYMQGANDHWERQLKK